MAHHPVGATKVKHSGDGKGAISCQGSMHHLLSCVSSSIGLILGWHNPFHLALDARMQRLPKSKAFLSMPLGHSRKPQILELVAPYLQTAHPSVLELFARYTPRGRGERGHWMSVGNESVKFNQIGVHVGSRDAVDAGVEASDGVRI